MWVTKKIPSGNLNFPISQVSMLKRIHSFAIQPHGRIIRPVETPHFKHGVKTRRQSWFVF